MESVGPVSCKYQITNWHIYSSESLLDIIFSVPNHIFTPSSEIQVQIGNQYALVLKETLLNAVFTFWGKNGFWGEVLNILKGKRWQSDHSVHRLY